MLRDNLFQLFPAEQLHKIVKDVAAIVGGYCAFINSADKCLCFACSEETERRAGSVGPDTVFSDGHCDSCISYICKDSSKDSNARIYRCGDKALHIAVSAVSAEGQYLGTLYCSGIRANINNEFIPDVTVSDILISKKEAPDKSDLCTSLIRGFELLEKNKLDSIAKMLVMMRDRFLQQVNVEFEKRELYSKKELVREKEYLIAEKQAELDEVRLRTVKADTDPLFLFNSLSLIRNLSIFEGAEKTPPLLDKASALLRRTLNRTDEVKPITEELAYINDYIAIMSAPFEQKISLTTDISNDCNFVRLPQFTIHPFVEVLYNQLVKNNDEGEITLKIDRRGDCVSIYILLDHRFDDGFLILIRQLQMIADRKKTCYGDRNIESCVNALEILRDCYGGEFRYNVFWNWNRSLMIQFQIPYGII